MELVVSDAIIPGAVPKAVRRRDLGAAARRGIGLARGIRPGWVSNLNPAVIPESQSPGFLGFRKQEGEL